MACCEFDNYFYFVVEMSLITSESKIADCTMVALGAFIAVSPGHNDAEMSPANSLFTLTYYSENQKFDKLKT